MRGRIETRPTLILKKFTPEGYVLQGPPPFFAENFIVANEDTSLGDTRPLFHPVYRYSIRTFLRMPDMRALNLSISNYMRRSACRVLLPYKT